MAAHPIVVLRDRLAGDFTQDLPPGVSPVSEWCAEPQFFPGATGLLSAGSWSSVEPGVLGLNDFMLPVPHRGVMVIGNYQASLSSYRDVLAGKRLGFPTTWRVLRRLMADVAPSEVFLTNAYIGLPDVGRDTAPFPTTPEYSRRCQNLLRLELELIAPRLVVCLGVPAAKMLAAAADGLGAWSPWPGYAQLANSSARTVLNCTFARCSFTAVAVPHPSFPLSTPARELDAQLISEAAGST